MTRRRAGRDANTWALGLVAASSIAVGVVYASAFLPGGAPGWAPWLFIVAIAVMMVATMALGAARGGSIGRLWIPFLLVLVIVVGGFGAVLALPPAEPGDLTLWLGLPPRAAVVLYGIGLLPFLVVPVAYAWTFDELTLGEGDLERVRDEALQARAEMARHDGGRPDAAPDESGT